MNSSQTDLWIQNNCNQNPSFFVLIDILCIKFIWKSKGPRIAKVIKKKKRKAKSNQDSVVLA